MTQNIRSFKNLRAITTQFRMLVPENLKNRPHDFFFYKIAILSKKANFKRQSTLCTCLLLVNLRRAVFQLLSRIYSAWGLG
jgi:hypothetical protein